MITLIAAVDRDWGIGKDGGIPWQVPEDLTHFRDLTCGHTVLMGRATYESIGRPLPKRTNIVLSSQPTLRVPRKDGLVAVGSFEEALKMCDPLDNTFVIGGQDIYKLFLPYADKIELTFVNGRFGCDRKFPAVWPDCALTARNTSEAMKSKTGLEYCYGTYELSHSKQHKNKEVAINIHWNFADESLTA